MPGLVGEPQLDPLVGCDRRPQRLDAALRSTCALTSSRRLLAARLRERLDDRLERLAVAEEAAGEDEPDQAVVGCGAGRGPRAAPGGSPQGTRGVSRPQPA